MSIKPAVDFIIEDIKCLNSAIRFMRALENDWGVCRNSFTPEAEVVRHDIKKLGGLRQVVRERHGMTMRRHGLLQVLYAMGADDLAKAAVSRQDDKLWTAADVAQYLKSLRTVG